MGLGVCKRIPVPFTLCPCCWVLAWQSPRLEVRLISPSISCMRCLVLLIFFRCLLLGGMIHAKYTHVFVKYIFKVFRVTRSDMSVNNLNVFM